MDLGTYITSLSLYSVIWKLWLVIAASKGCETDLTKCVSITWLNVSIQRIVLIIIHAVTWLAGTHNLVLFSWHWILLNDTHAHAHTCISTKIHRNTNIYVTESGVYLLATWKPILGRQGWWKGKFALFWMPAAVGRADSCPKADSLPPTPMTTSGQELL